MRESDRNRIWRGSSDIVGVSEEENHSNGAEQTLKLVIKENFHEIKDDINLHI